MAITAVRIVNQGRRDQSGFDLVIVIVIVVVVVVVIFDGGQQVVVRGLVVLPYRRWSFGLVLRRSEDFTVCSR